MEPNKSDLDCAVCLQKCHHPAQLPCGHIFCFLCVKGVALQSKKCAMCRSEIPADYLDSPKLINKLSLPTETEDFQWFYEGRNGWWKYDERSNSELEASFNAEQTECSLLLAGALYSVDFQHMIQVRRNDPTRRRRVKRDTPQQPSKGIAGIKILVNRIAKKESNDEVSSNTSSEDEAVGNVNDIESSFTLLDSEIDVNERLSALNLQEPENNNANTS